MVEAGVFDFEKSKNKNDDSIDPRSGFSFGIKKIRKRDGRLDDFDFMVSTKVNSKVDT